jgi:hypothetical protein
MTPRDPRTGRFVRDNAKRDARGRVLVAMASLEWDGTVSPAGSPV